MIKTRIPMHLTIDLPEEKTAILTAKAGAQGVSTEEYVRQVLEHDLAPDWLQKSWEGAKAAGLDRLSVDEIDAEIAAARKARHNARL
jgi:plasmid stability protein